MQSGTDGKIQNLLNEGVSPVHMNTIVVGTLGLDDIETPFRKEKGVLGGSATYAGFAASFFCPVGIVSVMGKDFPKKYLSMLKKRNISLDGIETIGKTFRWAGKYEYTMNEAITVKTELNGLAHFKGNVPEKFQDAEYVFLANIDPSLQSKVLKQLKNPKLVIADTMNFWIKNKKKQLLEVMKNVDVMLMNDAEARMLFDTPSLVKAAKQALSMGPKYVIIKKGEHGSVMFSKNSHFAAPGYPLENVIDPTGAGDSFAGTLLGYISSTKDISNTNIRKAMVYGTAVASYNAEGLSLSKMKNITRKDIEWRVAELKNICCF